eukprot:1859357-Ditylum_brightwellii.AAC.1
MPSDKPSQKPQSIPPGCNSENPQQLGNGFCDANEMYNNELCEYDGGDCCAETCLPTSFDCSEPFDCKDPAVSSFYVSSADNIALHKPTAQSSSGITGASELAVDGNLNGNFVEGSTTHTESDNNPFWKVDLQG